MKLLVLCAFIATAAAVRFGSLRSFDVEPVKLVTLSPQPLLANKFFDILSRYVQMEGILDGPIEEITTPNLMKKMTFHTSEKKYINFLVPQQNQVVPRKLVKTIVEIPQQIDAAIVVVPVKEWYQEQEGNTIPYPFMRSQVLKKQFEILKKIGHVRHIITVLDKSESSIVPLTKLHLLKSNMHTLLRQHYFQVGSVSNPVVEIDIDMAMQTNNRNEIHELVETLDETVRSGRIELPTKDDPFVFVVEEVEQIQPSEIVVTGKVLEGRVRINDNGVILMPERSRVQILRIEKLTEGQIAESGEKVRLYITGPRVEIVNPGDVLTKPESEDIHQVKDVQVIRDLEALVYLPISMEETRIYNQLPAWMEPGYSFQPMPIMVGEQVVLDFYKGLYKVPVQVVQVKKAILMDQSEMMQPSMLRQGLKPGMLALVKFQSPIPVPVKEGLSFFLQKEINPQAVIGTGRIVVPHRIISMMVPPLSPLRFSDQSI